MENDIIYELLKETDLIVPLDDELVTELVNYCYEFIGNEDFNLNKFNQLVNSYLDDSCDANLKQYIKGRLKEDKNDSVVPDCVFNALNFYSICISINDEDYDEETISEFSLSLKNSMIKRVNNYDSLKFQSYLYRFYEKDNLSKGNEKHLQFPTCFIKRICSPTFKIEDLEEKEIKDLKSTAYLAWMENVKNIIDRCTESDPFKKTFKVLDIYFKELPRIEMAFDVRSLIARMKFRNNRRKSIYDIITTIRNSVNDAEMPETYDSTSSHLYNLIWDIEKLDKDAKWQKQPLTPRDFFIYYYFELLLEFKLAQDDDRE